jgi:hypothetical protein
MANVQVGYGHGDVVGVPFDFYAGATLVTASTITMQTGILVLNPTGAISVTVNLPLNPVDGAQAQISNASASIITLTAVNANTGDSFVAGATAPTALQVAGAAGEATSTVRWVYTLNGFQPASGAAVNPRTWLRVQ